MLPSVSVVILMACISSAMGFGCNQWLSGTNRVASKSASLSRERVVSVPRCDEHDDIAPVSPMSKPLGTWEHALVSFVSTLLDSQAH
jgi:hypothetical protein